MMPDSLPDWAIVLIFVIIAGCLWMAYEIWRAPVVEDENDL